MDILSPRPDIPLDQAEFRKVLFRALLFPLVSAFLLALLIAWQIKTLLEVSESIDRSQQVISQSLRVQKLLMDMETNLRGFALTRDRQYFTAYEAARYGLSPAFGAMKQLLAEHPREAEKSAQIGAAAESWVSRYSDSQINRLDAGRNSFNPDLGRKHMTAIREDISKLVQSASLMREERVYRARDLARVLSGGGVILALSIGFFLATAARRHIYRLTDLYGRTMGEREKLLERETRRSEQLQALAELAVALNTTVKLEDRMKILTEQAREIIGADLAVTSLAPNQCWEKAVHTTSFSSQFSEWKDFLPGNPAPEFFTLVCKQNRAYRLSQPELVKHYAWNELSRFAEGFPPWNGWLAAPLVGQDGVNLGLMQLSRKTHGSFSAEDEFILMQIAQVAAVAVENSRLFEAEREAIRARDEFLSIASHELKTPLTSLRLQVQLLDKMLFRLEPATRTRLSQYFSQAMKSMERITHLVDDMLDISRISAKHFELHKENFELNDLIREVIDRLSPLAAQSSCSIELDEGGPVWGEWDRFRMDQVVTNLVSNAVKYGAGKPIQIHVQERDGQAMVEVQDQGIGIAREHHEKIFQRFERVNSSRSVSGMGLGLYITRQIVDMHEGQLEVESEIGKGATFRLKLPLERAGLAASGLI